jgi:hypothetical protein
MTRLGDLLRVVNVDEAAVNAKLGANCDAA